jgi:hypothetical protein
LLEQDERKFQIESTSIQTKHKTELITFFGVIVLEFSSFGVINSFLCATLSPWLSITTVGMVSIALFTILCYLWDLQEIEKETRALNESTHSNS